MKPFIKGHQSESECYSVTKVFTHCDVTVQNITTTPQSAKEGWEAPSFLMICHIYKRSVEIILYYIIIYSNFGCLFEIYLYADSLWKGMNLSFLPPWVNRKTTTPREGKLWIQTRCTPLKNLTVFRSPLQRNKISLKRGILSMTLNCIWWWGSTSGNLESVKYPFITITSRFTLTQSSSAY